MSYYNYQNFNMMNTGWGGFLQQGLGMFGRNSYGMMGMGGSIFGGSNFFTNCFGEPNYNAMAGFGVANALIGVLLREAVPQIRTEKAEAKQAEIDTEARLETVEAEIKEKNVSLKSEETAKTNFNKQITSLTNDITTLKSSKTDLNNLKNTWTDAYSKDPNSPDTEIAKKQYNQAEKANNDIDAKINAKKEEIEDITKNKIPECNKKIAEFNGAIDDLNIEKAKLEEQVTNNKLAKAQGKKHQATKQEDFNAKWDNGEPKTGAEFTAGDMRFAIGRLSNAVNDADKKAWAKKIDTIYSYFQNNDKKSITSDFKFAAQTAQKYLG